MRAALALLAAAALLAAVPAAAELEVRVLSPAGHQPVYGEVEVIVEVAGDGPVERVELFCDGRQTAVATAPPWRFVVDVGMENAEHTFQVFAFSADGGRASFTRTTPRIVVNEEMRVELVQLYVTASDDGGRVLDLGADDFTVTDDGREESLVTFARGDIPFAATILVDTSSSMVGGRLAAALEGARAFAAGMRPLDEARLLAFSDRLRSVSPFTSFPEVLTAGLGGLAADGGTAINDVLYLALTQLEERQGRRVVVLLTDGVDTHSALSMRDLLPVARRSRALIYWIRVGDGRAGRLYSPWRTPEEYDRERSGLRRAVRASGGRVVDVASPHQLRPAFTALLDELREQYVLGYYPADRRHDGRFRPVEVDVARGGVKVRTAAGWVDR